MNGRINGSGVLMTPPPEYARVVRIWEKPTTHVVAEKKGDRYRTAKQKKQDDEEMGDLGDTTADGFSLPGTPFFSYILNSSLLSPQLLLLPCMTHLNDPMGFHYHCQMFIRTYVSASPLI